MNKSFLNKLSEYKDCNGELHKLIVSLYIKKNNIQVRYNNLIKNNLICDKDILYKDFVYLNQAYKNKTFNLENLIELFEILIPKRESAVNGAVFTPAFIKDYIVEYAFNKINRPTKLITCADISCGCGAFLLTIAKYIHKKTKNNFKEIYKYNIFGSDISDLSITRTKLLLSLLAVQSGEDESDFDFNLHTGNTLKFNKETLKITYPIVGNGFDIVVGNPPYVRAKNIEEDSKYLLKNWESTRTGNPDLYIPFFEIGMALLNSCGFLGYITVNSFFKSVNARSLRKYFYMHRFEISIIDFGNEKLFGTRSAYTCICFISNKKGEIGFVRTTSKSLESKKHDFNTIRYDDLDYKKGWLLNDKKIINNINKIESCGKSLGDKYKIKNGIATLANYIYIFKPKYENEKYYICQYNNKEFEIEKSICKDVVKPNILKNEDDLKHATEKLIYPYMNSTAPLILIDEVHFKTTYPKAYRYLSMFKDVLANRDKGKKNYKKWYAYGRDQALTTKGFKLLFPYMAKEPLFILCDDQRMFIYCGYAIFCSNIQELKILKKILLSKIFWYYIKHSSKPYSGNYYSLAKNYVKNFGICELTKKETELIIEEEDKYKVDKLLCRKYGIDFDEL